MSRTTARPRNVSTMFADLEKTSVRRSVFNRSHGYKSTFNGDYLYPVFLEEVLPGDTFSVSASVLIRMTTPVTPFMDNVRAQIHYFFVPNRLVWEHWEEFLGANKTSAGIQQTSYLVPSVYRNAMGGNSSYDVISGSIADYFGIPPHKDLSSTDDLRINALPFRAYNLIWNEWFRDENLQDPVTVQVDDGPDSTNDQYVLLKRNKKHDYFTSALPWPQKGPNVQLTGSGLPITASGMSVTLNNPFATGVNTVGDSTSLNYTYTTRQGSGTSKLFSSTNAEVPGSGADPFLTLGSSDSDLSGTIEFTEGGPFSINNIREAFQVQKFYERQARGGTRYTELIRSHFGVVSPDARLQRPEFLGVQTFRLNVNQVAQSSSTDTASPQGNLAAYGLFAGSKHGFSKSFVEHGLIIGLLSITADLTYQQGINRMLTRSDKFDYFWPVFAHLGEQPIYNYEIFEEDKSTAKEVFGYQERYAEYRYYPSMITGLMRSNVSDGFQSLDVWHLAQDFAQQPNLNSSFIEYDTPFERVSAVQDQPIFYGDIWYSERAVRPIPVYGTPGLVDHF